MLQICCRRLEGQFGQKRGISNVLEHIKTIGSMDFIVNYANQGIWVFKALSSHRVLIK